jgi:protein-L-isoaspartate(D-aspartate) O-methyltransferase
MTGKNKRLIIIFLISAVLVLAVILLFITKSPGEGDVEDYSERRHRMVEEDIVARGIKDSEVIEAMIEVPRHQFVSQEQVGAAYEDRPLSIGEGQTISQPYIVALMTEELDLKQGHKVLEIGTGSGYQAAILAEITDKVYTVEIISGLYDKAEERLNKMYPGVMVSNHNGYYGWEEYAPYDRIIVTAAPDHIPPPLISQLTDGGIMIIPVGPPGWNQVLWKVKKEGENVKTEKICDVVFVPLVGY